MKKNDYFSKAWISYLGLVGLLSIFCLFILYIENKRLSIQHERNINKLHQSIEKLEKTLSDVN